MSFSKKTVKDINLAGKTILLRADYNVPIDNKGNLADDYRIKQSVPTIEYLLKQKCKIVIISHLGRPDGKNNSSLSLEPAAKRLSQLIKQPVQFALDCVGENALASANSLDTGQILVLENLRFHPGEEANSDKFALELSKLGDVLVQDGFGVVHRAHASTAAITKHLPSVAGLLLEREVEAITSVMEKPQRPLMAIIGGAKIADKLDILNRLIDMADFVAIGGAMANTFLLAENIKIGKSLADRNEVNLAKIIIKKASQKAAKQHFIFYLPQDGVVATSTSKTAKTRLVDWDAHIIATEENYPKRPPRKSAIVASNEEILDIGPFSGAFIAGGIQLANTVIWNGTMGVTETPSINGPVGPFAHGTELIIDALLGDYGHKPFTLVGGGDTTGYIEERGLIDCFGFVSTGGGASLELMAGKKLPGVEALMDKKS